MHDFTLLVLRGTFATGVAATLDILRVAAALAPRVRCRPPTWRVLAPEAGAVPLGHGLSVEARALPQRPRRPDASTWILPGMSTETPGAIGDRLARPDAQRAVQAVRAHVAHGGAVAAACSAVFLLQAAGVLAGRRVTTSWWLGAELQRLEPACTVAADQMVCAAGPVVTAGAAFAQADLMLHLLRARCGPALAELVGRVLLLDAREAQAPFTVPAMLAGGDALVARLTRRIEAALPEPPTVADLASACAMSERTLARHVRAATGMSPLALVQSVRINRARALIAGSRLTIAQVAAEVGYADATALRRLMRKRAGANPSRFRPQVGQA